jgi:hypothetical protein
LAATKRGEWGFFVVRRQPRPPMLGCEVAGVTSATLSRNRGGGHMIWTQGLIELVRWRRQRRALAAQGAQLVAGAERFLAEVRDARPYRDPPLPGDPPRSP